MADFTRCALIEQRTQNGFRLLGLSPRQSLRHRLLGPSGTLSAARGSLSWCCQTHRILRRIRMDPITVTVDLQEGYRFQVNFGDDGRGW